MKLVNEVREWLGLTMGGIGLYLAWRWRPRDGRATGGSRAVSDFLTPDMIEAIENFEPLPLSDVEIQVARWLDGRGSGPGVP